MKNIAKRNEIESGLHLERLVFDEIHFERLGFSSEQKLEFEIQSNISQKQNENLYKVNLKLKGSKPNEYIFSISLSGFFSFSQEDSFPEDVKNILIKKNAVAILMPYLRSEVSLLTAQPNMDCVVLPAFNINRLLEQKHD